MYSLDNIYKSFDNNQVLKGVSLEIPKNKTTVLIGPSGSGKTTLLRCINLLEIPDSGTVTLNGSSMSFQEGQKVKYSGSEIRNIRMKTGMVFQNFQLFSTEFGRNIPQSGACRLGNDFSNMLWSSQQLHGSPYSKRCMLPDSHYDFLFFQK